MIINIDIKTIFEKKKNNEKKNKNINNTRKITDGGKLSVKKNVKIKKFNLSNIFKSRNYLAC